MPTSATLPRSSATITDVTIDHPDVYVCYRNLEKAVELFRADSNMKYIGYDVGRFVDLSSEEFHGYCVWFLGSHGSRKLLRTRLICDPEEHTVTVKFHYQDDGTWLMAIARR